MTHVSLSRMRVYNNTHILVHSVLSIAVGDYYVNISVTEKHVILEYQVAFSA